MWNSCGNAQIGNQPQGPPGNGRQEPSWLEVLDIDCIDCIDYIDSIDCIDCIDCMRFAIINDYGFRDG